MQVEAVTRGSLLHLAEPGAKLVLRFLHARSKRFQLQPKIHDHEADLSL